MSFAEVRFPDRVAYGAEGGPEFSTDVVIVASGYEQRNQNWEKSRARYNVATGVRSGADVEAVIAFFYARRGRAQAFRFKDWGDYLAEGQSLGAGDGTRTQFQLRKLYASGPDVYERTIRKPVAGTVRCYINGSETSAFTLDETTGVVTFDSPPADGATVEADFEFDVPVRFDTDSLPSTLEGFEALSVSGISLVEVRV